jgi:hypothetical protein
MKITKNKLKQIIKEEIMNVMREGSPYHSANVPDPRTSAPDDSDGMTAAVENAVETALKDAEVPLTLADIIVEAWGSGGGDYDEEQPEGWGEEVERHMIFLERSMKENGKVKIGFSYFKLEIIEDEEGEVTYSLKEEPVLNLRGKTPTRQRIAQLEHSRDVSSGKTKRSPGDFRK